MAYPLTPRQFERSDRHVERCHVRGRGPTSRTQITLCVEEALRLISLPGENEGRVYYFRHVVIANLPRNAHRQQWIEGFGNALHDLAIRAIHGSDSRAAGANAVFFHNHQEALETLLARTLLRASAEEWFWPQLIGITNEISRAEKVLAIIEDLRETEGSWATAADSIVRVLSSVDPVSLLTMLPPLAVNGWLRELACDRIGLAHTRPIHLPQKMKEILVRSVRVLGKTDPRVVWLGSLVVLHMVPSELAFGQVVIRARATLLELTAEGGDIDRDSLPEGRHKNFNGFEGSRGFPKKVRIRIDPLIGSSLQDKSESSADETVANISQLSAETNSGDTPAVSCSEEVANISRPVAEKNGGDSPAVSCSEAIHQPQEANLPGEGASGSAREGEALALSNRVLLGEPTCAAGLYFLLNALHRLGISEALAAYPAATEHGLVAQVLKRLALVAQVDADDPVWYWINAALVRDTTAEHVELIDARLFPSNLRPSPRKEFSVEYFSRVWCVAVRRWCRRLAGMTVPQVVNHMGLLSINRTGLDVTLPLDSAEIGIRRAGLDIDPGWLPWFGKVVRFHYVWEDAPRAD